MGITAWENSPEKTYPIEKMTPKDKMLSAARVAEHIFLVGGSGEDWHPNGWCASTPIDGSISFEIPFFSEPIKWKELGTATVFHRAAGLTKGAFYESMPEIPFNDSFLALACNILQNMIRFGEVKLYGNPNKVTKQEIKKRTSRQKREAKKLLAALVKRYPGRVPSYCGDLLKRKNKIVL